MAKEESYVVVKIFEGKGWMMRYEKLVIFLMKIIILFNESDLVN